MNNDRTLVGGVAVGVVGDSAVVVGDDNVGGTVASFGSSCSGDVARCIQIAAARGGSSDVAGVVVEAAEHVVHTDAVFGGDDIGGGQPLPASCCTNGRPSCFEILWSVVLTNDLGDTYTERFHPGSSSSVLLYALSFVLHVRSPFEGLSKICWTFHSYTNIGLSLHFGNTQIAFNVFHVRAKII